MPRNIHGGNRAKKQARKSSAPTNGSNSFLRIPKEKDEKFGVVTKMFGHGQMEVQCIDGKKRLCIIRNKFKGKGKQNNIIKINMWVLVGLRSWEVKTNKKETCDLLEMYSEEDKQKLRERVAIDFSPLNTESSKEENALIEESNIIFENIENSENSETNQSIQTNQSSNLFEFNDSDDEINIDEI